MPEACEVLGISEGAVRKRTTRGTLRSERDAQGRVKDKAMDPNGYGR